MYKNDYTNGEIIETLFPQFKIKKLSNIVIVFGEDYVFQHHYPRRWWDARYETENEEYSNLLRRCLNV